MLLLFWLVMPGESTGLSQDANMANPGPNSTFFITLPKEHSFSLSFQWQEFF